MIRRTVATIALAAGGIASMPALADENIFAYSYGSETLPKGGSEAYVWITDRRDKNWASTMPRITSSRSSTVSTTIFKAPCT